MEHMITIDRKNKMAVDIALHIPLPSFRIRIEKEEDSIASNTELTHHAQSSAVSPAKTAKSDADKNAVQTGDSNEHSRQ